MQCREFQQMADSYLSEELLVETTHEMLRHLETCPACRDDVAARRRLRHALRAAFTGAEELRARPGFIDDLAGTLRARAGQEQRVIWSRTNAVASAAAVVLLVSGVTWYLQRGADIRRAIDAPVALSARLVAVLERLSREAAGDHRDCALEHRLAEAPISLADAGGLYDAAYGSLSEVVERSLGASLPGGAVEIVDAHACVLAGRRFAHVVLQYRGQLVSVLVTDPPAELDAASPSGGGPVVSAASPQDGFHIALFRTPRHVVFVVSELDDADVLAVARTVSGPVYQHLAGA